MLKCDYLSLSFVPDEALRLSWEMKLEMFPQAFFWGYRGFRQQADHGSLFWGEKHGRHLVVASSSLAAEMLEFLLQFDREEEKCNRMDLQHSQRIEDCDAKIGLLAQMAVERGKFRLTYVQTTPIGRTLYVGAPSSDRRLRVYNKSAQLGVVENDEMQIMRVELVLRNRMADKLWKVMATEGSEAASAVGIAWMLRMIPELSLFVDFSLAVELPVESPERKSYRNWIEYVVKPALARIAVSEPELLEDLKTYLTLDGLPEGEYHEHTSVSEGDCVAPCEG